MATWLDESLPNVSLIITTYNRKRHLLRALESVFTSEYPKDKLEVIVVDDASEDSTYETVERRFGGQVNLIRNRKEMFLAESRNRGFKLSKGDYVLHMDDDCLIAKDTIRGLVKVMKLNETFGVIGPSVCSMDGRLLYCGARIFPFFMPIKPKLKSKLIGCEFVPGTIGLFRREAALEAGLWDSRNFAFQAEDADVCLRIRGAGYRTVCVPWAKAYHLKNRSLLDVSSLRRAYEAGRSRILLYKRHLRRSSYLFYIATVNIFVMTLYVLFITLKAKNSIDLICAYLRGVANGLSTPIRGST